MNDSEQFDRAIERVWADQSPRDEIVDLSDEEQRMVRMAQLLRGTRTQAPNREFVTRLGEDLFPRRRRVSRRFAMASGLGTLAAGLAAGFGIDRALNGSEVSPSTPLVGANGRWTPVAQLVEVPEGSIKPFTAGAVQGFLIHHNGKLRAMSRICTHMGCTLNAQPATQSLLCPCHGVEFSLEGQANTNEYIGPLPALPRIDVRVNGDAVEVWSV